MPIAKSATMERVQLDEPVAHTVPPRVRAVVLLAGSLQQKDLRRAINRPLLELPVEAGRTVLCHWGRQVQQLAEAMDVSSLPMRVMIDQSMSMHRVRCDHDRVEVTVERDPVAYRGTAGVLRDITLDYAKNDYVVVANANQLLFQPLADMVERMLAKRTEACLVTHGDQSPGAVLLFRCGTFQGVPAVGFSDMKEQFLSELAKRRAVSTVCYRSITGISTRRRADYVNALRCHHRRDGGAGPADPTIEDWSSSFAVVETGGEVHAEARLHDSVVLSGGRVEAGALVARSIICEGAVVSAGQRVVDAVVSRHDTRKRTGRQSS